MEGIVLIISHLTSPPSNFPPFGILRRLLDQDLHQRSNSPRWHPWSGECSQRLGRCPVTTIDLRRTNAARRYESLKCRVLRRFTCTERVAGDSEVLDCDLLRSVASTCLFDLELRCLVVEQLRVRCTVSIPLQTCLKRRAHRVSSLVRLEEKLRLSRARSSYDITLYRRSRNELNSRLRCRAERATTKVAVVTYKVAHMSHCRHCSRPWTCSLTLVTTLQWTHK